MKRSNIITTALFSLALVAGTTAALAQDGRMKADSDMEKNMEGEKTVMVGGAAMYPSKNIVENANKVTLEETGDWFDRVTVNRHMKSMNESFKVFQKTLSEVHTLQQRMESTYDEIGEVLSKYYEIKEGNEFGAERAKAIAKGKDEFEVDGKKYPVKSVDKDDKENAKEFTNESKSMKLTSLLNESFGLGELPSSKLKKMKVSAKEMMDSVNPKNKAIVESFSTEEKRIVMMAVRKIAKYMNRDLATALRYVIGAAQELERSGKVK